MLNSETQLKRMSKATRSRIKQVLKAELSALAQMVLIARHVTGMTYDEIALTFDLDVSEVEWFFMELKNRLRRLRDECQLAEAA